MVVKLKTETNSDTFGDLARSIHSRRSGMVSGGSARSVCAAAPGQSRWLARFCFNSFILADSEK
jgi:hypothetical protein